MSDARTPKAVLTADGVEFGYRRDEPVLRAVNLTAREKQLLCVLGPNGSGKTTLLRCLLGQLAPSAGEVLLNDVPVSAYRPRDLARSLGYVPQFPKSAFGFTAKQIVLMGRLAHTGPLGLAGDNDRQVVRLAMEMTDTSGLAERTLDELSGGEAQRVMIARALAQQPAAMLLDEPTSHLDVRHQMTIYRMMSRLAHDWGMAVVCVSHDVNLAARFADQLLLVKDGAVHAAGTPAEVVRPEILSQAYDVDIELIDSADGPIVRAR